MALLEVRNLQTQFFTREGVVHAVDGIDLDLDRGRTLCLVGESGCGKSVTALSIIGLLPRPPARIVAGEVTFDGRDLAALPERELQEVRGRHIAMIFQDPMTSLNPTLTLGTQMTEGLRRHLGMGRKEAQERAAELLDEVGIPNPRERLHDYPHRLSGGMRQRVMIASAIACEPELLIADEPTTALDVTVQAQVLEVLDELRRRRRMALLLITHDMGVVAATADDVAVMYAGQIVEQAPVDAIFSSPEHPYTEALLGALPQLGDADIRDGRLTAIPGRPPALVDPPQTCRFAPRCPFAGRDGCAGHMPDLREIRPGHLARTDHPASSRERAPLAAGVSP